MDSVKIKLDELVEKYETEDFIKDDPIQFPHRFEYSKDIEIAGFISSLLAYVFISVIIQYSSGPFGISLEFLTLC